MATYVPNPKNEDEASPSGKTAERTIMPHMQHRYTEMCKFHAQGACTKGDACLFAHSKVQLQGKPDWYRTKMCKSLLLSGTCDNPRCNYAHSVAELRTPGDMMLTTASGSMNSAASTSVGSHSTSMGNNSSLGSHMSRSTGSSRLQLPPPESGALAAMLKLVQSQMEKEQHSQQSKAERPAPILAAIDPLKQTIREPVAGEEECRSAYYSSLTGASNASSVHPEMKALEILQKQLADRKKELENQILQDQLKQQLELLTKGSSGSSAPVSGSPVPAVQAAYPSPIDQALLSSRRDVFPAPVGTSETWLSSRTSEVGDLLPAMPSPTQVPTDGYNTAVANAYSAGAADAYAAAANGYNPSAHAAVASGYHAYGHAYAMPPAPGLEPYLGAAYGGFTGHPGLVPSAAMLLERERDKLYKRGG